MSGEPMTPQQEQSFDKLARKFHMVGETGSLEDGPLRGEYYSAASAIWLMMETLKQCGHCSPVKFKEDAEELTRLRTENQSLREQVERLTTELQAHKEALEKARVSLEACQDYITGKSRWVGLIPLKNSLSTINQILNKPTERTE